MNKEINLDKFIVKSEQVSEKKVKLRVINETFPESEFLALKEMKDESGLTWREFILRLLVKENKE